MNTTFLPNTMTNQSSAFGPVVYDVTLSTTLSDILYYVVRPMTLLFGMCTNVTTFIVYYKLGLRDTVTITFWAITFSDLWFLCCHFVSSCNAIFDFFVQLYQVSIPYILSPVEFSFVMIWYGSIPYNISVVTTMFISIQRCLCVALPLQFKGIFTTKRTLIILVSIYLFIISVYVPILTTFGLRVGERKPNSTTYISLYFVDERALIELVYYWMMKVIFNTSQVVIFICAVVLCVCLQRSSRFRQAASSLEPTTKPSKNILQKAQNNVLGVAKGEQNNVLGTAKSEQNNVLRSGITHRDQQVIKCVMLVMVLFLLSNLPENILFYVSTYVPGFGLGNRYHNIFILTYTIRSIIEFFNASIYIFVYYKYNSKFRRCLKSLGRSGLAGQQLSKS